MTKKYKLELYHKDTCPYCHKVLDALAEMGREVPLKSIRDNPKNLEHLIATSGKKQVPCLFIDGEPMHESDAIILWLIEHADTLESTEPMKRM
jgi:glutaredoxin 3